MIAPPAPLELDSVQGWARVGGHRGNAEVDVIVGWGDQRGGTRCPHLDRDHHTISFM